MRLTVLFIAFMMKTVYCYLIEMKHKHVQTKLS